MKLFNQSIFTLLLLATVFSACEKADKLPFYGEGVATVLSSPTTTVAPVPSDSNSVKLILNWTDPKYAQDPSLYKFVIEIDSTTKNFTRAYTRTVIGKLTDSIVAKELNAAMLGWGFEFNKAYDLDVRVAASYGNNNELKYSNILKIRATPYKIPPKVTLPFDGKLWIVGSATQGDWSNPINPASNTIPQTFSRIDETTFGGIFDLKANAEYLILPENQGAWANKYSIANKNLAGVENGGDFGYNLPDNFKGPASAGLYKITLDFQQGKFKVEPFAQQHGLPTELTITGGATPLGWTNPVGASQVLNRLNSVQWDITLNFTTGEKFLILPTNGSWDRKFGVDAAAADNKSGTFRPEGGDIPTPAPSGSYKFTIDFFTGKYQLQ
jgi:starch-binding outer membrane protein SusE/F